MTPLQSSAQWLSRQRKALLYSPNRHAQIAAGAVAAALERLHPAWNGDPRKIAWFSYQPGSCSEFKDSIREHARRFKPLGSMIRITVLSNPDPRLIDWHDGFIIDEGPEPVPWRAAVPESQKGALWLLSAVPFDQQPHLREFEAVHQVTCDGPPICTKGGSMWPGHDMGVRGRCARCGWEMEDIR